MLNSFLNLPQIPVSLLSKDNPVACPHIACQSGQLTSGGKSAMQTEDWYDYPEYYDRFFRSGMAEEFAFVKKAIERFCPSPPRRLLEPACGTGRLLIAFAGCGYECTGFDINKKALAYLRRKLRRRGMEANVLWGDMRDFRLNTAPFDAAFNAVGSFLHLTSEEDALAHLRCVQQHLRQGGIYVLAMHLLPRHGFTTDKDYETLVRGKTRLSAMIQTDAVDRRKRLETLNVTLRYSAPKSRKTIRSRVRLRTYTLQQLRRLLSKVPEFSLRETYDFSYDVNEPVPLNGSSEDIVLILQNTQ